MKEIWAIEYYGADAAIHVVGAQGGEVAGNYAWFDLVYEVI